MKKMLNCDDEMFAAPPMNVIRHENDIYFYADVNQDSILALILNLKDAAKLSRDLMLRFPEYAVLPINVHINSNGGSVYDCLAAVDTIEQYKKLGIPVHTYIEGCCFSAATILASCGSKRYMSENATYMIHEMSTNFTGKLSDMENVAASMKNTTNIFKKIYSKYSKLSAKEIKTLIEKERYITSEEVLNYGLIDEILS